MFANQIGLYISIFKPDWIGIDKPFSPPPWRGIQGGGFLTYFKLSQGIITSPITNWSKQ
jgi:hypothetical protein